VLISAREQSVQDAMSITKSCDPSPRDYYSTMMMKAAVLLLLPLAASAFSPLAGYTATKSSTIALNGLKSNLDWRSAEGDPEPEVRYFVRPDNRMMASNRVAGLPRGTQHGKI
jgi:hypothetical protein